MTDVTDDLLKNDGIAERPAAALAGGIAPAAEAWGCCVLPGDPQT